jgi:hypothetical protein
VSPGIQLIVSFIFYLSNLERLNTLALKSPLRLVLMIGYRALPKHVVGLDSGHNNCVRHCDDFKSQRQRVANKLARAIEESK